MKVSFEVPANPGHQPGLPHSPPRSCGSQPKISKTTPCKVAGGRRHGCALGKYLTRRANQRHSFIIAQSVKRTPGRAMAATAVNVELILPPRQSRGVSRLCQDRENVQD